MDEFYKHFAVPTTKPYSIKKKVNDFSFEWKIVKEKLTDTRRCLDIGGHIGIYAYEYSKIFDKVETFEPSTKMFNLMNQNIHSIENISMHNVGVSDKNGTELMYENPVNTESNVVVSNETKNLVDSRWGNGKRWAGQIPVVIECRSIDSYQFTDVDFIKIDTEEYITPVISGMIKTLKENNPVIQCENVHNKVIEILRDLGYKPYSNTAYDWFYARRETNG